MNIFPNSSNILKGSSTDLAGSPPTYNVYSIKWGGESFDVFYFIVMVLKFSSL